MSASPTAKSADDESSRPPTFTDFSVTANSALACDRTPWSALASRIAAVTSRTTELLALRTLSRAARCSRPGDPHDPLEDFHDAWWLRGAISHAFTPRSRAYVRAAIASWDIDAPNIWSEESLGALHRCIRDGEASCGEFRRIQNYLLLRGDARIVAEPPPPARVAGAIEDLRDVTSRTVDPAEQLLLQVAAFVHFLEVHPFIDGNGRVARIALARGVCASIHARIPSLPIEEPFFQREAVVSRAFLGVRSDATREEALARIWTAFLEILNDAVDRYQDVKRCLCAEVMAARRALGGNRRQRRIAQITLTQERVSIDDVAVGTGYSRDFVRSTLELMQSASIIASAGSIVIAPLDPPPATRRSSHRVRPAR
jgi:hypothetical protein